MKFDPRLVDKLVIILIIVGLLIFELFIGFESAYGIPKISISIIIAVCLLILTIVRFDISLILYILIIPYTTYELPGLPFHIILADLFLILISGIWFIKILIKKSIFVPTQIDVPIILFLFITFVSFMNSVDINKGIATFIQNIEFFGIGYWIFTSNITNKKFLLTILKVTMITSIFISIKGLHEYFLLRKRIESTLGHFNAFGTYTAMIIPIAFSSLFYLRDCINPLLSISTLLFNSITLLLTFCRGGWVSAVFSIFALSILKGFRVLFFISIFIIISLLIFFRYAPEEYKERAESITVFTEESYGGRFAHYKAALYTISHYPILGVGLDSVGDYTYKIFGVPYGDIHNIYLHIGAERGLIGLFFFLYLFGQFLVKSYLNYKKSKSEHYKIFYLLGFASISAYLVVNLSAYQLVRGVGLFFPSIMGITMAAKILEEKELNNESPSFKPAPL